MMRPWKLEWRYCQHSGAFTPWRVWATYTTKEAAEKAAKKHEERWKHALGQFRLATSPTPKGQDSQKDPTP